MITSRLLESAFEDSYTFEIYATEDDLKKYVKSRLFDGFSIEATVSDRLRSDIDLENWVIETIVGRAQEMYATSSSYARTYCASTNDQPSGLNKRPGFFS